MHTCSIGVVTVRSLARYSCLQLNELAGALHSERKLYRYYILVRIVTQPSKRDKERGLMDAISEVSKGDCIIMGDFNHGNIKWDTLQCTGVEDQKCLCLVQDNF